MNPNMNVNPETMVDDDMYNTKYRVRDKLKETILFVAPKQITVGHTMFKVTSFIDFWPYFESLNSLENYFG